MTGGLGWTKKEIDQIRRKMKKRVAKLCRDPFYSVGIQEPEPVCGIDKHL